VKKSPSDVCFLIGFSSEVEETVADYYLLTFRISCEVAADADF